MATNPTPTPSDDADPSSPIVPWEIAAPLLGISLIDTALEARESDPTSEACQELERRLEAMEADDASIGSHTARFLVATIPEVAHSVACDLTEDGDEEGDPREIFAASGVARAMWRGTFDAGFEPQMVSLVDAIARSYTQPDVSEADASDTQAALDALVATHLEKVLRWSLDIHAGMLLTGTPGGSVGLAHARQRLGELALLFGLDPADVLGHEHTSPHVVHVDHDMAHLVVASERGAEQLRSAVALLTASRIGEEALSSVTQGLSDCELASVAGGLTTVLLLAGSKERPELSTQELDELLESCTAAVYASNLGNASGVDRAVKHLRQQVRATYYEARITDDVHAWFHEASSRELRVGLLTFVEATWAAIAMASAARGESEEEYLALIASALAAQLPPTTSSRPLAGKVGRNDPCPCGSGRKYKLCCGG